MHHNRDPSHSDFLFEDGPRRFRSLQPDAEMLKLEQELRARNLLWHPEVQWLMEKAVQCSDKNARWARDKFRMILEAERIHCMRTGEVFALAPPQLLSQGQIHLVTQLDGESFMIPRRALSRGLLIAGPQGSGKSRFVAWLCRQLNAAEPRICWWLVDPKLEFKDWAESLDALYLDCDEPYARLDLKPPPGLSYESWLTCLAPQIGQVIGAIYGIQLIQEAGMLCIQMKADYEKKIGPTEISLQDLFNAVPFVPGVSSGRRSGYKDAVITGLSRILSGSGQLFKCRRGIDLAGLLERKQNVIFGTRSITDRFSASFLVTYLVWFLHEFDRYAPPSDDPKSCLIIDDASRYIATKEGFDKDRSLSSLAAALMTLRSSGRCFCAVSQAPHLIDPGVLSQLHTVVAIGGLHYKDDTQLLAKMMGLDEQQRLAISHLKQRECVAMCASAPWSYPVHSYVPFVEKNPWIKKI